MSDSGLSSYSALVCMFSHTDVVICVSELANGSETQRSSQGCQAGELLNLLLAIDASDVIKR